MSLPFTNFNIDQSLAALSSCFQSSNTSYQRLLAEPDSIELCAEAGKTLRLLSRRYARVLIAIIDSQSRSEPSDEWDSEERKLIEEEFDD